MDFLILFAALTEIQAFIRGEPSNTTSGKSHGDLDRRLSTVGYVFACDSHSCLGNKVDFHVNLFNTLLNFVLTIV